MMLAKVLIIKDLTQKDPPNLSSPHHLSNFIQIWFFNVAKILTNTIYHNHELGKNI